MEFARALPKIIAFVVLGLIAVLGIAGLSLLLAFPVKWMWNYVAPSVTKGALTEVNFWQAWVGAFLCQWLFKGSSSSSK